MKNPFFDAKNAIKKKIVIEQKLKKTFFI